MKYPDDFVGKIIQGDCIEVLRRCPDNCVDAIVSDPPAGISFMGKSWDTFDKDMFGKKGQEGANDLKVKKNFDILPRYGNADMLGFQDFICQAFTEAIRVLKPGGYALVWAIPRTSHHTAMGLERAGFEIRDVVNHIFGSGFPKSLNIGKAVDKLGGQSLSWFIDYILKVADEKGISRKEITMLFPSKNGNPTGWLWNKQKTQGITLEQYHKIKEFLQLPFADITECEREVIGQAITNKTVYQNIGGDNISGEIDITKGTSEYEGWGTALKPAVEHWILCRKPLSEKTVALNVLKWGTGGINIDGCRIGTMGEKRPLLEHTGRSGKIYGAGLEGSKSIGITEQGRFPANLILQCTCDEVIEGKSGKPYNYSGREYKVDGFIKNNKPQAPSNYNDTKSGIIHTNPNCPCYILDRQSGKLKSGDNCIRTKEGYFGEHGGLGNAGDVQTTYGDIGGASRFFYCAKASKSERNRGCEGLEEKQTVGGGGGIGDYLEDVNSASGKYGSEKAPTKNNHPTVKPLSLCKYLVKLITPPGGIVLDPFAGSGSTLIAAKLEGFNFIGIEKEKDYVKIANARLNAWHYERRLF